MSQTVITTVAIIGVLGLFTIYSIQRFIRSFYTNTSLAVQKMVLSNKGTRLFAMVMLLNVVFTIGFWLRITGIVAQADNFAIIIYLVGISLFMLLFSLDIARKWREK